MSGDEIKSRCEIRVNGIRRAEEQMRDASKRDAKRLGADVSNEIRVNEKLEELTKRMRDAKT